MWRTQTSCSGGPLAYRPHCVGGVIHLSPSRVGRRRRWPSVCAVYSLRIGLQCRDGGAASGTKTSERTTSLARSTLPEGTDGVRRFPERPGLLSPSRANDRSANMQSTRENRRAARPPVKGSTRTFRSLQKRAIQRVSGSRRSFQRQQRRRAAGLAPRLFNKIGRPACAGNFPACELRQWYHALERRHHVDTAPGRVESVGRRSPGRSTPRSRTLLHSAHLVGAKTATPSTEGSTRAEAVLRLERSTFQLASRSSAEPEQPTRHWSG
jgi:hypothetical protein